MISSLEILGFRGFATREILKPSLPTGHAGSGLTVVVGANNAGKSTITEAIQALRQHPPPTFAQGRRNSAAGDKVELTLVDEKGARTTLRSRLHSSQVDVTSSGEKLDLKRYISVPSRRVFDPYFSRIDWTRDDYLNNLKLAPTRSSGGQHFAARLFAIERNKAAFDDLLGKVLDPLPEWSIDEHDTGQHFIKLQKRTSTHSSEGAGDGIVSLIFIIDALYDSKEGDTIVIDEPELSLHPALQRRLSNLLFEHSAQRQIIIATHSPYFVKLDALGCGGSVARVYEDDMGSRIAQIEPATGRDLIKLLKDKHNPHILGLNAQEIFFVEDGIVLLEGQEDVTFFAQVQNEIEPKIAAHIFGWGVGGAENMGKITKLLAELGYSHVVGILDGNKAALAAQLQTRFEKFAFFTLPADDIRSKRAVKARDTIKGLLDDENDKIRPEYLGATQQLFQKISDYLIAR